MKSKRKNIGWVLLSVLLLIISSTQFLHPLSEPTVATQTNASPGNIIFFEGFEGSWLPEGWNITIINTTGDGINGNWTQESVGLNPDAFTYEGDYMAMFNSFYCGTGKMARLETPELNMEQYVSGNLGFWMYHDTGYEGSMDRIMIQVSLDGGNWINLSSFNRYDSNGNIWKWHQVNLPLDETTENLRIGFLGISDFGGNMYIDQVTIFTPFSTDVGVVALLQPEQDYIEGNTTVEINATIKNFGSQTQSNIPMIVNITGPMNYFYENTNVLTTPLAMNETATIQFDPSWTAPNIEGTYIIKVFTELDGDEDETNDMMWKTMTIYRENALYESFEKWLPEGWALVDNGVSHWEQDNVFQPPHTGNWSAYVNRNPGSEADCWLITPRLSLQEEDILNFWYTTGAFANKTVTLEVKMSLGESQKNISQFSIPLWKDNITNNEWMKKSINLNKYADYLVYIGFHVCEIQSTTDPLFVDDVYGPLLWMPTNDVGVVSLNQPQGGDTIGTYTVNATVKNYGTMMQSFLVLCSIYQVNWDEGGAISYILIYQDVEFVENLASGKTAIVLFSTPWNITQPGYYAINITTLLPDDENPANNYLNQTINIVLPYIPGLLVEKTVWDPFLQEWVDQCSIQQGNTIRMQIVVVNTFDKPLVDVNVTDILPKGLTYANEATVNGDDREPDIIDTNITWFIPSIPVGSAVEIEFNVTVEGCGKIENKVNVTGFIVGDNGTIGWTSNDDDAAIIAIDITPPVTNLSIKDPKYFDKENWWISNSTLLNLSATDDCDIAITYYRIWYNDSWSSWQLYTQEFTLHNECKHIIEYYSIDLNQNTEEIKTKTFFVDNSPPQNSLTLGIPNYVTQTNNVTMTFITMNTTIELNASDTGECATGRHCIYYSIWNETNWTGWIAGKWNENLSFTLFESGYRGEGKYIIEYYAVDPLRNIEKPYQKVINVDNSPPETTIHFNRSYIDHEGHEWISLNTSIELDAVDQGVPPVGTKEIFYAVNDGEPQQYQEPFTLPMEGTHTIRYYSRDYLNNTEEERKQQVMVDGNAPKTTIEYIGPSYREETRDWITSDTQIVLHAHDHQQSGVNKTYYRVDDGPWIEHEENVTIPWEGTHIIEYYSIDNVGNAENLTSWTVIVYDTPPIFTVEPREGWLYIFGRQIIPIISRHAVIIGKMIVTVSVKSNLSVIDRVHFALDGTVRFKDTKPPFQWVWDNALFFNHKIQVTAYDRLGHSASKEIKIFIMNT